MSNPNGKSNKGIQMQVHQRQKKASAYIILGGLGNAVLPVNDLLIWQGVRQPARESMAVPVNFNQPVTTGTPPGPCNSNTPTGRFHDDGTLPAKFYKNADGGSLPDYPQDYLVHNLEHNYAILWHSCELLDDTACSNLEKEMQGAMEDLEDPARRQLL